MFEHYTEGARRVIFFARYEAAQTGSPYIETGHLLLGLLREGVQLFRQLGIAAAEPLAEECRKRLGSQGPKLSTSVDLPLSNPSKRVLVYASEEAVRLGSKWIGLQHVTMGLLREGDDTSEIVKRHGITLEKLQAVRAPEGTTIRWPATSSTVVPVEFVCDGKAVGRTDVTVARPWPRIGETIVLGKDERAQVYTVVDIRHFYADLEGSPENKPVHVQRIVVTLQPSKPSQ